MDSKNIIKDSDAPPKAEEGNEFHELYNEAKLSQPIKKLEVSIERLSENGIG
jgi:hypothetical protein